MNRIFNPDRSGSTFDPSCTLSRTKEKGGSGGEGGASNISSLLTGRGREAHSAWAPAWGGSTAPRRPPASMPRQPRGAGRRFSSRSSAAVAFRLGTKNEEG